MRRASWRLVFSSSSFRNTLHHPFLKGQRLHEWGVSACAACKWFQEIWKENVKTGRMLMNIRMIQLLLLLLLLLLLSSIRNLTFISPPQFQLSHVLFDQSPTSDILLLLTWLWTAAEWIDSCLVDTNETFSFSFSFCFVVFSASPPLDVRPFVSLRLAVLTFSLSLSHYVKRSVALSRLFSPLQRRRRVARHWPFSITKFAYYLLLL